MNIEAQINRYINSYTEPKRSDLQTLHDVISKLSPDLKLWFYDGKNSEGQTVSNPSIGYGLHTIKHANGTTLDWFRIGVSANKTGISVYILGISEKNYLPGHYGEKLGKASVSGYCIRFKKLADIDVDTLASAIEYGLDQNVSKS